jgi:exodeoxyribonuclease-5
VLNWDSPLASTKLLIVDEVSMVGEDLARDLLRFKKPILVLGDPAQLPPIRDAGYFINAEPDILLTEVHRQAQNNPIIKASMDIRQGKNPEAGSNDMGSFHIIQRKDIDISTLAELCVASDQVLCGRNQTRITLNNLIRKTLGIDSVYPVVGDRLVCLKNDKNVGVFNGSL